MDGNFKADHMKMKCPEDDVWLLDGQGYFVNRDAYAEHIRTAVVLKEVNGHLCCNLVISLKLFRNLPVSTTELAMRDHVSMRMLILRLFWDVHVRHMVVLCQPAWLTCLQEKGG